VAWITLNNPSQYNSYTTEMVKGVHRRHGERFHRPFRRNRYFSPGPAPLPSAPAANTKEYSEYYSRRPEEYGAYMELFNNMVDAILACKKPVISRVNGMRVAGGQESYGLRPGHLFGPGHFGQAGPRHGSAPDGGSSDFLPWFLSMEDAMWNCVSCEMWSAYKMKAKTLISKLRAGPER